MNLHSSASIDFKLASQIENHVCQNSRTFVCVHGYGVGVELHHDNGLEMIQGSLGAAQHFCFISFHINLDEINRVKVQVFNNAID